MNFEQRDEIQAQVFPAEISADKQKSVANRLEKMSSAKILPVATDHLPSAVSRHASTNASNNSICIRAASSRTIPRGGFVSVRRGLPRRVALHRVSKQYVKRVYASIREEDKAVDGMGCGKEWFARFRETWRGLWFFGSISGLRSWTRDRSFFLFCGSISTQRRGRS